MRPTAHLSEGEENSEEAEEAAEDSEEVDKAAAESTHLRWFATTAAKRAITPGTALTSEMEEW